MVAGLITARDGSVRGGCDNHVTRGAFVSVWLQDRDLGKRFAIGPIVFIPAMDYF
jgi:hypothetical protein